MLKLRVRPESNDIKRQTYVSQRIAIGKADVALSALRMIGRVEDMGRTTLHVGEVCVAQRAVAEVSVHIDGVQIDFGHSSSSECSRFSVSVSVVKVA